MSHWEEKRAADAAQLLTWLIQQGATAGVSLTRADMAQAMGWPHVRIDVLVRWLRENPQMGFAISMRRGNQPWCVVSRPTDTIQGQSILDERRIAYDGVMEGYWRITRQIATEYVHWNNIASNHLKGSNEAARARKTRKEHRNQLVLIQSALQPQKRPNEAELDAFIDEVLNA